MDSINITLKTKIKIPDSQLRDYSNQNISSKNLASKTYISKIKYIEKSKNEYMIQINFPKAFNATNSYLVTTQKDVDYVLNDFLKEVSEYFVVSIVLTRVDYPFTFIMPVGRTFSSYVPLFRAFTKEVGNAKAFLDLKKLEFESIYFTDTKNTTGSNKKILIYNQYRRMEDTKPQYLKEDLIKFPNLKQRLRIEVSLRKNKQLKLIDYKSKIVLSLSEIKKESFDYFNFILNEDRLKDEVICQEGFIEDFLFLKSDNRKNYSWNHFLKFINNSKQTFCKRTMFSLIKEKGDLSVRGKEYAIKTLKELLIDNQYVVEDMNKDFNDIRTQLKKELSVY